MVAFDKVKYNPAVSVDAVFEYIWLEVIQMDESKSTIVPWLEWFS